MAAFTKNFSAIHSVKYDGTWTAVREGDITTWTLAGEGSCTVKFRQTAGVPIEPDQNHPNLKAGSKVIHDRKNGTWEIEEVL